jgi:hypothetical protein
MGNIVADGEGFMCPMCTGKIKLSVSSCSTKGDSKKLATEKNYSLSAPGAQCIVVPTAPQPCQPSIVSVVPGQMAVKIDGATALGASCMMMCAKGGMLSVSSSAQSVAKHGGAGGAATATAVAAGAIGSIAAANDNNEARPASAPVGSPRAQYKNSKYQKTTHKGEEIKGRAYSGHALDQMQNRGIPPSVVEETINTGQPTKKMRDNNATIHYYDGSNNITVVLNEKGGVITVGYGKMNRSA